MIFVDMGAWVARFSRQDQYHEQARKIWADLKATGQVLMTSDAVFAETITLLGRKIGPSAAVGAGRLLHGFKELTILRVSRQIEVEALSLLEKYSDQSVGFVDCLSFAIMRGHHISTAFSFDRHFRLAGFQLLE